MSIVNKELYKPRTIDAQVNTYLENFGAICIEGPKWCGKTWTSSYHSNSELLVGDPEGNFQNRQLAEIAPTLILEGKTPRLIDEWQTIPALWDAVRCAVDIRGLPSQFILTGSSVLPDADATVHTGTGRICRMRMRPMSLYESGESSGTVSIQDLFDGKIPDVQNNSLDIDDIVKVFRVVA